MKINYLLTTALAIMILLDISANAQSAPQKRGSSEAPPISPMPMKPEMTEVWEPQVSVVTPGKTNSDAPSDAIILFNGKDLSKWSSSKDTKLPAGWAIKDGYFEVKPGVGDIQTLEKFEDCQLHLEWSAPDVIGLDEGQMRGNSGIFFQNRYELQILDSYQNRTYRNGQAASIYKDQAPLVNAMRKPDEWNTYDVVYTAPRFKKDGSIDAPARMTVFHNGVLVQNNSTILGITYYIGVHKYEEAHQEDVIRLQDHGCLTQFRNIWIRKL